MTHILLKQAFIYKRRQELILPSEYTYDKIIGGWFSRINNKLLVQDKNYPIVASKKRDVETGEDEKGQ